MSEELFATGISLVEQALDSDAEMQQLQEKLKQQQAVAAAAEKLRAEEAARSVMWPFCNTAILRTQIKNDVCMICQSEAASTYIV